MYLAVTAKSNWVIYMVVLNSSIHTVMYAYYASCYFIQYNEDSKLKQWLTAAQMIQFYTAIAVSSKFYFNSFAQERQITALVFTQLYMSHRHKLSYGTMKGAVMKGIV